MIPGAGTEEMEGGNEREERERKREKGDCCIFSVTSSNLNLLTYLSDFVVSLMDFSENTFLPYIFIRATLLLSSA